MSREAAPGVEAVQGVTGGWHRGRGLGLGRAPLSTALPRGREGAEAGMVHPGAALRAPSTTPLPSCSAMCAAL